MMETSKRLNFIKITEKLVTPKKIATVFQGAEMLRKLPRSLQKMIMEKGAKTDPYISFIVEPYSFFLAYEVLDEEKLAGMLPANYELVNTSMFQGAKERKCVIIGAFNVHTSVFWGNRVEIYIIARNKKTGMVSWIIQEYETNTISYDPGRGFIEPGTKHSVLTTSFLGEIILDVESKDSKKKIQVNANIKRANSQKLNRELWIEGNLSVDYGGGLSEVQTKPFGLIFDPAEMNEALAVNIDQVDIIENTFLPGLIKETPFEVCCFPFAQHFYTTSIPMEHTIENEKDLENEIAKINSRNGLGESADNGSKQLTTCPGYCYSYACINTCQLRNKNEKILMEIEK
jgi:hypothetical protein